MNTAPTSQKKPLSILSRFSFLFIALFHFITALMFFFKPDELFYLLNVGPKVFRAFIDIPTASEHFFIATAASNYILIGLLLLVAGYHLRSKTILLVICAAKLLTVFSFMYLFNVHAHYFAYVAGATMEAFYLLGILLAAFKL